MDATNTSRESTKSCPHCGGANSSAAAFCVQCGKALPTANSGPRIIEGKQLASTKGGQQLQSEQLAKKARSASGALLAVAILTTIGSILVFFILRDAINDPATTGIARTLIATQIIVTLAYWVLWIWSRSNPLPAAIVGLVVFLSLILVNTITVGPETIVQGLLVKVIIIVVLIRAIQAGMQHRALLKQLA